MPIYEYGCKKCKKTFEYTQRMSDPPKRKCEACGGMTLERLISQTSFHLKGGGWYKDLYASPKPAGAESSKTTESSDSSGGESTATSTPDAGAAAPASGAAPADSTEKKPAKPARSGKAAKKGTP